MLLIVFVMLYSLTAHCASFFLPQENVGDKDGNEKSLDYEEFLQSLEAPNPPILNAQKRNCRFGLHSHNCALSDLAALKVAEIYLKSADSPGKRSSEQGKVNLSDLISSRGVYDDFGKRDCRWRLGGHCLTEALDRAANQYYYLKSHDSPGRRRRETTMSSSR